MKNCKVMLPLLASICVLTGGARNICSQEKPASAAVDVHLVITDAAMREDSELPPLQKEDIKIKMGKNIIDPTELIPATGDRNALQLMILIDDILDSNIGNDLKDLQEFIKNLPEGAQVGVGYMSNAGISVAQNFTADRELAAKAIRLPRGTTSSMDSPYLSLISLVKGWPQQKVRREVIMISDGIDRLRGERPEPVRTGPYNSAFPGPNTLRLFITACLPSVTMPRMPARSASATTSSSSPFTRWAWAGRRAVTGTDSWVCPD
jgi:hypothetical protein